MPSIEDEAFRDLIRCIEDARGDQMRARHRLSKFLLRRGQRFEDARAWSAGHLRWLRALAFDDACSQSAFADYLASVELLAGRRGTLLDVREQQIPECVHAPVIARLRCFRGIDTLSAAGLCAEVGSFTRFPRPTLVSGFLGIVPSEHTSDTKRRQGAITKAGPGHARRLLVEAAHHYSRPPRIGAVLARRHQGQDPRVIEIAWRAQRRLHQRWQHLRRRAEKARRRGRDRGRPRTRRIPLGGRHTRCLTAAPPRSRPGRCRGEHEHPGRPTTVAPGPRAYYGQPAPAGRARS